MRKTILFIALLLLPLTYFSCESFFLQAGNAVAKKTNGEYLKEVDQVEAGSVIGYIGITGNANPNIPHLHLGIRSSGQWTNPVDYLNATITTTNVKIVTPCD